MMPRVHYGKVSTLFYRYNGRKSFFGSRAGSVLERAKKLENDPKAEDVRIRIDGKMYSVEDVEVYRR